MLSSRVKRSPHDFIFKQELGNGSYSRVYKAVDRRDSQKVFAVKVCSKQHIINENKVKYVTIEKNTLNLLARAHHPGIVKLHSTFHDEENLYFVLDFAAGGELLSLLHRVGRFTEIWSRHFIAQLIDTIEFIHSQGVIHRDLKPENVLLHRDGRLMITDFGTATTITKDDATGAASFVGTADYVSPELLLYNRCQFGSDIWALGCMLYQFIQGVSPFRGDNELHTFEKIVSLEYPWANSNTGGVVSLVHRILTLDPSQRPNISSIKKDTWFDQIDWNNKELLWRGIWQVHPQRQQQLGLENANPNNDSNSDNNLAFSKPKKRKPAKVGNTTSSIVEWRKKLGIETFQTDIDRKPNTVNNNNIVKHNITTSSNNKNTKPVRNNCMQIREQADLKTRTKGPSFKSPMKLSAPNKAVAMSTTQSSTMHFVPPHNRSNQVSETTSSSPMTTPPTQVHKPPTSSPTHLNITPNALVTRPSTAPAFQRRTPSPIGKSRPSVQASISKAVSPLNKISPPHPVTPASSTSISTSLSMPQLSGIASITRSVSENSNGPTNALPQKVSMPTQKLPPTSIASGKPASLPPKTAPPRLSLDTGERPRVLTNNTAAAATASAVTGDAKNPESDILKQGFVHVFEIPFKSTGPDISLQSYKRIDNDLITKFVGAHKLELKPVDQPPGVLTLFENGMLQYRSPRNSAINYVANIGDSSLSMYDFEFYERQNRGFLILEKYHFKIWFISLPKVNNQVGNLQLPIIGSDENWVDCIFRARQLVEDQGLVNKLNNVEVSSPGLSSPTIPVTSIYSKPKAQPNGSSANINLAKKYVAPDSMVVTSSRPQVVRSLNRNKAAMDASMGASVAFKSSQKK